MAVSTLAHAFSRHSSTVAPDGKYCFACNCYVPPIHNTIGLVFAKALKEEAVAVDAPRNFKSAARSVVMCEAS